MKETNTKLRHVNEITEYDKEHFQFYLDLFDMKEVGKSWLEISAIVWPSDRPEAYKKYLKEHYKRAKWMTLTGFKFLMRDNPMSKSDSFDMLVSQGKMTADERAFLESEEGAKFWPSRTKH